jgi:NAD(P)-dependent dehydrogenase (short-subunit alcohol dehydrogenase family)
MGRLQGKVALVTGSGRGFGRGVALAFAHEDAQVVAAALEQKELDDLSNHLTKRGENISTVAVDLSREKEILKMRDEVLSKYGRLDILVNNAAVSFWKTMEETSVDEWDYTLNVNLRAYFLNAKAFLESMKENKRGSIINITSTSAELGFVAEIAYCPSKYGIEGLTQCMALELRPYNIAANTLNVSSIKGKQLKPTGLTLDEASRLPSQTREVYSEYEDLASSFTEAWTFLALQDGSGVTGQRFRTLELTDWLKTKGWESIREAYRNKLTRAVYQPIDFPKSVRYQTAGGGWKEIQYQ